MSNYYYDEPDPPEDYPEDVTDPSADFEQIGDDIESEARPKLALQIPALDDRPARLVSMEQEIGGDANTAVEALHSEGLTSEGYMRGYHSGGTSSDFCYVEEDGSVDGEIIYSRMRLDNPRTARKLEDALGVVQTLISEDQIGLDSRCGFHIHVGLSYSEGVPCYSMENVVSLYHLWNYVEDTVFRLASANWRHHRTEGQGCNYSPPTPKRLAGAVSVGRGMSRERGALNLSNFLAARGYCSCGAFDFGDWSACTCNLEKATVEFRVFNATANKRKIRAYTALCLALVAYAERNTCTAETHPVDAWRGTAALNADEAYKRLHFILRELPLTEEEREDIRYCAERSTLKSVVQRIRRRKGYRASLATA